MKYLRILIFLTFFPINGVWSEPVSKKLLLVYTGNESDQNLRTERIQALKQLTKENNFALDTARIGPKFSEAYLKKYAALVFIQPAPEMLNFGQRTELERYIQAGGGMLQISLPPTTDGDWPWYTRLQEAGLKAQYVKSFQVADKNQLKYWRTAFDGGFYSQITLTHEKQSYPDSDWFDFLPNELDYLTSHPVLDYQKATFKKIP